MKRITKLFFLMVLCLIARGIPAFGAGTYLLNAKMSDIDGHPMAGAKLFIYDSTNVRRPADFISSLSGSDGRVQIELPPGKYWMVGRFKNDGKYGPLLPGDKHSGEPLEVDLSGGGAEAEFVIADIRELGQKKRAMAAETLLLKGHVLDLQGIPVSQAFIFANRSKEFNELPDFISAWTDVDGIYEIQLPPGATYFIGASRQFPLVPPGGIYKQLVLENGKIDIAIDIDLTVQ